MKNFIILSILITTLTGFTNAQQNNYWQQTNEPPTQHIQQGNTCITSNANTIFVGTMRGGLFRSNDKGKSWDNVLPLTDTAIQKVVADQQGKIVAIAATNLYISQDNGDNWQKKPVPAQYELTDLELFPNGNILVSSHVIVDVTDEEYDYFGDGILRSTDNGDTWQTINNGIGFNKAISNIARSSTGILVASMPSTLHNRGGLYYSSNNGDSWQLMNKPRYKGTKGKELISPTSIYEILCLEFDRNDNLYFSYEGVYNSTSLSGGLISPIVDVLKDSLWQPFNIDKLGYDWQFHPFYSIHLSKKNKHLYTSLHAYGSKSFSGAYVKQDNAEPRWIKNGIDPVLNSYLKVMYTEDPDGRIYAVQLFDHKVYYTDSSASEATAIYEPELSRNVVQAWPNPANDQVYVKCIENGNQVKQVNIIDLSGRICLKEMLKGEQVEVNTSQLPAGLYLLEAQTRDGVQRSKLLIGR